MFNFCTIEVVEKKRDVYFIEPKFKISVKNSDLMIRGKDFYAVWDEDTNLWVQDEQFVVEKVDEAVWAKYNEIDKKEGCRYVPVLMDDADSGVIDKWHKYCQKQLRDNYHELDKNIIFQNDETTRSDYATKKLPYSMVDGDTPAYDELIGTLYDDDERQKLEWALGSIISGESKNIQKFIVLYGEPGTGKGTFLSLVSDMFEGYWNTFDAKALGSGKDFALASFKMNPLISIQQDGNLSKIEDNTLLNSITSHEYLEVNEKFKSQYTMKCESFLFMGTNSPVKITDANSGILRRLIDVYPSGKRITKKRYNELTNAIKFEFGAIANKVLNVFNQLGEGYYDAYVPLKMFGATNDFYDFIEYYYDDFASKEYVPLLDAWELYQKYCDLAKVPYPLSMRKVRTELMNYFDEFRESYYPERGVHYRSVYFGFKTNKFIRTMYNIDKVDTDFIPEWLTFKSHKSVFDYACSECLAQLAGPTGKPPNKWINVKTKLSDIDTTQLHWVKGMPINHIVIDFDLKDKDGNKSIIENIKSASKFPPTYAELSKSGQGIHLHYIYEGNPKELAPLFEPNVEIKVFSGNSALRRMLTKCNDLQIAVISSGLPTIKKENNKMVDDDIIVNEYKLIKRIENCIAKKHHGNTKSEIDYIKASLDLAYEKGFPYDVSRMKQAVWEFASHSSNQAPYCQKLVGEMKFKSKDIDELDDKPFSDDAPIAIFDCEVYPNLFLINWSFLEDDVVHRMINPSPMDVAALFKYKLVGFNCIRYDNIMLYMRAQGADNMTLFRASQSIINGGPHVFDMMTSFNARNISYIDLYDVAAKKQSLKKWEIELHIHHKELPYDWNEPIPKDKWGEVAAYCDNDVIATKALYHKIKGDIRAREIVSVISGLSVNTPDNKHTAKYIFGDDKHHKDQFIYTDLTKEFPEYKFENGHSTYFGEEVGEGGAVRATPGMYEDVWVFDVLSMHPHTIKALNLFGDKYTKRFYDLVELRAAIKHGYLDKAREMFDGKLIPYLEDKSDLKAIAQALKIMINSVYGLTAAKFDNPFRDPRNVDNIVAKRGALFILKLKRELEARGVQVIHVKTDSIKVPSPSDEIKAFIEDFGKQYGYSFEVEHIYKKFCLVNNAVYIAKYAEPEIEDGKEIWWDATGKEFQRPVVYKTLFSKEPLEFYDICETREVKNAAIYLSFNDDGVTDESKMSFVGRVGSFCPVTEKGGILLAKRTNKDGTITYSAVADTKGYKWLEADDVDKESYNKIVDMSYYNKAIDSAKKHIEEFGDYETFIN